MANANGSNKLIYWLLSLLAAVILSIGGSWANGVSQKADRVPTLEAVQKQQAQQLDRIEGKLDKLLEQRGNR